MEIKFKNGSEIKSVDSNENKRSKSSQIIYCQNHPEEFLEFMGYDLGLHLYQKLWIRIMNLKGR